MNKISYFIRSFLIMGVFAVTAFSTLKSDNTVSQKEQTKALSQAFFSEISQELVRVESVIQKVEDFLQTHTERLDIEQYRALIKIVASGTSIFASHDLDVDGELDLNDCDEEELVEVGQLLDNPASILFALKDYEHKLKVIDCIARKDLDALKNMSQEELMFNQELHFMVPGSSCVYDMDGRLDSFIIDGMNALTFAVYRSVVDATSEDRATTINLLHMLLDKGLSFNDANGFECYLIKNESDDFASDYIGEVSMLELAEGYSYEEVQRLVAQHTN